MTNPNQRVRPQRHTLTGEEEFLDYKWRWESERCDDGAHQVALQKAVNDGFIKR